MELLGISFGLECCEEVAKTLRALRIEKVWEQLIYILYPSELF